MSPAPSEQIHRLSGDGNGDGDGDGNSHDLWWRISELAVSIFLFCNIPVAMHEAHLLLRQLQFDPIGNHA
jgi:hypothetical protein